MKKKLESLCPSDATPCSASSIPSRLPDGRMNPEYQKARRAKMTELGIYRSMAEYQKHRKEERRKAGKEISRAEYLREYRKKRAAEGRPLKQYPRTKESVQRWNQSEKGKAAAARYAASKKGQRKRHETGDEYASRIIRDLDEIYRQNANVDAPAHERQ